MGGRPGSALLDLLDGRFGLGPGPRTALGELIEPLSIGRGERLLRPGRRCESLWFLSEGAMRSISADEGGDEFTFFLFFEGSFVSDLRSLLSGEPSRFAIEALEPCRLETLPYRKLQLFLDGHPAAQGAFRALLETAYVELDRRAESLLLESAVDRYLGFLRRYGNQATRIPQHVVASWLGIKPESLSRIRRRLGRTSRP